MVMTINELIKEMEEEYAEFLKETGLDDKSRMEEERKNNPDCNRVCTANEMTLDILRKYQKIKQILKDIPYGGEATVRRIQEVVEDGND